MSQKNNDKKEEEGKDEEIITINHIFFSVYTSHE